MKSIWDKFILSDLFLGNSVVVNKLSTLTEALGVLYDIAESKSKYE